MNLNNVSAIKRRLIFEALNMWFDCKDKEKFLSIMLELGWSDSTLHRNGSFKVCIWKNSIIAKYAEPNYDGNYACNEIKREFEQYYTVPYKLKKYFPRSYILENGLLIQDRVFIKCNDVWNCMQMNKVNKGKFNQQLTDHCANHGHSKKGTIKFFDWVYRRNEPWLTQNTDKPLIEDE